MGHLINPVAFRLGWSKSWIDSYYINNNYYPEFMHVIFRLRLYFLYFFKQKEMQKLTYLYSHFNILKLINGLEVNIFYYDGRLESLWDEFNSTIFSWELKAALHVYDYYVFKRFYFLLIILLLLNPLLLSRLPLEGFVNSFLRNPTKRKLRKYRKNKNIERKEAYHHYLKWSRRKSFASTHFKIFSHLMRAYFMLSFKFNARPGAFKFKRCLSWDYKGFGQKLFYVGITYWITKPFFFHLSSFLSFMSYNLCNFYCNIHFFLISNNQVTATFLANYMAKRLQQGYRLMELVNPLRKELRRVKRSSLSKFKNLILRGRSAGLSTRWNYGAVFSKCLFYLFYSYKRYIYIYSSLEEMFANYDFLLISFFLAKKYFNCTYKGFFANAFFQKRFKGISRVMFLKQSHLLFFYKTSNAKLYGTFLFIPLFYPKTFSLMSYPDYYYFLREMFDNFYNNYAVLRGSGKFSAANQSTSLYPIYRAIHLGFSGFLRYLRFNAFRFKLSSYYNALKINRKLSRSAYKKPTYGLLGFKFHLKGRFTRKQIAASNCFREGLLPLSTLSANIDYAFSTVPLKNSAVGIKVWLYKADKFYTFYFKTI